MSISLDSIKSARYQRGYVTVITDNDRELTFPVGDNPRLSKGSDEQLEQIDISPFGIHWPALDEDLSLRGLLDGDHGQNSRGSCKA